MKHHRNCPAGLDSVIACNNVGLRQGEIKAITHCHADNYVCTAEQNAAGSIWEVVISLS